MAQCTNGDSVLCSLTGPRRRFAQRDAEIREIIEDLPVSLWHLVTAEMHSGACAAARVRTAGVLPLQLRAALIHLTAKLSRLFARPSVALIQLLSTRLRWMYCATGDAIVKVQSGGGRSGDCPSAASRQSDGVRPGGRSGVRRLFPA